MTTQIGSSGVAPAGGVVPTIKPAVGSATLAGVVGATTVAATKTVGLREVLQQLEQGFSTAMPADSALAGPSGAYDQATVVAELEAWLGLYAAVDQAKAAWTAAQAALHAAEPTAKTTAGVLKDALIGFFGRGNPLLQQFGIAKPKVRAKQTAAQIAVKAAKAKLTRELRGTTSAAAKAKLRYQGTLVAQPPAPEGAQTPIAESATSTAVGGAQPVVLGGAVSTAPAVSTTAAPAVTTSTKS